MSDSSNSSNDQANWASAQLGQRLKDSNPDELGDKPREAPQVPDWVAEVLNILKREYDPDWDGKPEEYDREDPSNVENTERFQEITDRWDTKAMSSAIRNGRDRITNAMLGVVEEETSIEKTDVALKFIRWVTREAGVTYLAGHMGTGKTDLGIYLLEIFYKALNTEDAQVHIATNVKSCARNQNNDPNIDFIGSQPDLQDWLDEKDGYKMFLFDEASSHATGYSSDASQVEKQMRSMIRLIRKNNASMTIVGHDGKDLHPTVRELADYAKKEKKKEALVFENVSDREGEDLKFEISEIPQTNFYYDTHEASTWEWATSEGEDGKTLEVMMGETYVTTKLNQTDVAEIFDVSQSKVSTAKKKYHEWEAEKA